MNRKSNHFSNGAPPISYAQTTRQQPSTQSKSTASEPVSTIPSTQHKNTNGAPSTSGKTPHYSSGPRNPSHLTSSNNAWGKKPFSKSADTPSQPNPNTTGNQVTSPRATFQPSYPGIFAAPGIQFGTLGQSSLNTEPPFSKNPTSPVVISKEAASFPLKSSPRPPTPVRPVGGGSSRYQNGSRGGSHSPQLHNRLQDNSNKSYGGYHSKSSTNPNYRGPSASDGSKSKPHTAHPNGYPEAQPTHRTPQPSPRPPSIPSPTVHHAPPAHQPSHHFHPQSPLQMHQPHPSPLQTHIRPPYPQSPISMTMASPILANGPAVHGQFTSPQQRGREKPGLSPAQIPLTPPIPHVTLSPSMSPMSVAIPPGTPVQAWGAPYYPYQYASYPPQFDPSTQQAYYRPVYQMPYGVVPHMPGGIPQQRMPSGSGGFVTPQPKQSKAIKIVNPETGGVVDISKKSSSTEALAAAASQAEKKDRDPKSLDSDAEFFSVPQKKISKAIPIVNPATKLQHHEEPDKKVDVKSVVQELEIKKEAPVPIVKAEVAPEPAKDESHHSATEETLPSGVTGAKSEEIKSDAVEILPVLQAHPEVSEETHKNNDAQATVDAISEEHPAVDSDKLPAAGSLLAEPSHSNVALVESKAAEASSTEQASELLVEAEKAPVEPVSAEPEVDDALKTTDDAKKTVDDATAIDNSEATLSESEADEDVEEQCEDSVKPDANPTTPSILNHDQLNHVPYPPNIQGPASVTEGKLRYDRSFLLQFSEVCREKPASMPSLESLGIEESAERRPSSMGRRPGGAGRGSFKGPNAFPNDMGAFKHTPRNNEERFPGPNMHRNGMGGFGRGLGPRTASGGMPSMPMGMGLNIGSNQGMHLNMGPRGDNRGSRSGRGDKRKHDRPQIGGPTIPLDEVAPLDHSENRWVPVSLKPTSNHEDEIRSEDIVRKVKSLLNKLTLEKFDSISEKITEYGNLSAQENDGKSLQTVIQITFEKATDEPNFVSIYASLCRRMMDKLSPEVKDENVKNKDGKYIIGGSLFRKYLLSRCQEEFEKGWKVNSPLDPAAEGADALLSDEYYIAAKAKRRGLGLIMFIGELFKLGMLTERIMHECIKRLLSNVQSPEEEETESLCKLMTTVGKQLDRKEAKAYMDTYFARVKEMSVNRKLSSRIRFMLLDIIELRAHNWVPRREAAGPKTISQIHEDAQKEKEETAEMLRKTTSSGGRGYGPNHHHLSRTGSERRDRRSGGMSHDGWNTVGNTASNTSRKVDLSGFGNFTRSKTGAQVSLGPGGGVFGVLGGGSKGWKSADTKGKDDAKPKNHSNSKNMFSALMSSERSKKADDSTKEPTTPERNLANSAPTAKGKLSKDEAHAKIKAMIEEYFSVRDVNEVKLCIQELGGPEYHEHVVTEFFFEAFDKKPDQVKQTSNLLNTLATEHIIEKNAFVDSVVAVASELEDISIDVPQAFEYMGIMMEGARIELADLPRVLEPLTKSSALNPPASKVVASFLKRRRDEQGEAQLATEYKQSKVDLKKFLAASKQNSDGLAGYLESNGIGESDRFYQPAYSVTHEHPRPDSNEESARVFYFLSHVKTTH
ncbi:hypothetical protein K493DRAFT_339395 [Basidiobolus meristosporus CBS 931.73]|uniref:MI domain-containing protein n=1 Tax=Basidiobolus meristosporus CBS 931.73 TaxID=1314790 RepID=A0A1Y1Y070_9FUNG|nr:hypothetical protein K493DRAFT_339395 [Basidiobolus meristosporus CBS 931.73]|eukprot:ORX91369.1 hypothetical protein K493DRAFT_339395 [Basidiobolus meristosporus CBS 931.73]